MLCRSKTSVIAATHQFRSFSTLDPAKFNRLRQCIPSGCNGTHLRGRMQHSYDFEKRIKLVAADSRQCVAWPIKSLSEGKDNNDNNSSESLSFDPSTMVVADVVTKQEVEQGHILRPHSMSLYYLSTSSFAGGDSDDTSLSTFDSDKKRRLQKDGDTNVVRIPIHVPCSEYNNNSNQEQEKNEHEKIIVAHMIQVIEPDVRDVSFQKMEAQIELITAFRNVLMEFFELSCPASNSSSSSSSSRSLSSSSAAGSYEFLLQQKPRFTTLRIPPLALAFHNGKFDHGDMEKMHHAALIQAFHRCSGKAKDWFAIHQDLLTVELFVPRAMLDSFHRAFYESGEAWETPDSAFVPKRIAMYPGMQMPSTLLENAPGFIGKREEIEALALPYEERVKKLEEIEEKNCSHKRLVALAGHGQNEKHLLNEASGEGEAWGEGQVEGVIASDGDSLKQIRMVEVKPAMRDFTNVKGGGASNIFT